jgi:hypothetical protein
LFYSATGKKGSATRECVTEPTGCTSARCPRMNDGSWNSHLAESLLINGWRGYVVGFVSTHVLCAAVPRTGPGYCLRVVRREKP